MGLEDWETRKIKKKDQGKRMQKDIHGSSYFLMEVINP
jgi:hypothetical protein